MTYSKTLSDGIGNIHPRKNLYLLELAEADSAKRKELKAAKSSHEYNIKLEDFKVKRKEFLKTLKRKTKQYSASHREDAATDYLNLRLFKAERKKEFYKDFAELSYDAFLEAKIAELEIRYIPDILAHKALLQKKLQTVKEKLADIDEDERTNPFQKKPIKPNVKSKELHIRKMFLLHLLPTPK